MKTFIINKDSWHYRMVSKNRKWDVLEYDGPKDFCSYWSFVMAEILGYAFITFCIVLVLVFSGIALYHNPVFTTVALGGWLSVFFGTFGLLTFLQNRSKRESLIGMKYRSWKEKVCAVVEYK
jgi:hypothetical protein